MKPEEGAYGRSYHGVKDEEEAVVFIPDLIQRCRAQNIEHQEAQNTNNDNGFAQFLQDYAGAEEDVPVQSHVDVKKSKDDFGEGAVVRVEFFVGGLENNAEGRVAVLHDEGVVKWKLGSGDDSEALGDMVVVDGELVTSSSCEGMTYHLRCCVWTGSRAMKTMPGQRRSEFSFHNQSSRHQTTT